MSGETSYPLVDVALLDKFNRYDKLGEGSYGAVYLMKSIDNRAYAVKEQDVEDGEDDTGLLSHYLIDTDALLRLRSSSDIVKLVGISYTQNYLYLAMEVMDCNLTKYCLLTPV